MATSNNHRVLAIDVECVATGYTHEDRSPCSVAIVNDRCEIIYSSLIKPTEKVVSDLYPFTGLRIKDLEQAPSLEEVLQKVDINNFSTIKSTLVLLRYILFSIQRQSLLDKVQKMILNGYSYKRVYIIPMLSILVIGSKHTIHVLVAPSTLGVPKMTSYTSLYL